jgi:hypothetical protein
MADNKIFKIYQELPQWAKGVVVVGGLVVTYIVGNTVYKKIKSFQDSADAQNKLNQLQEDLDRKLKQGQQPSFSSTQYNNFADSIQGLFEGCDYSSPLVPVPTTWLLNVGWSNSGASLFNILYQFNNDVDFLALQKAFGTRTISKGWYCGGDYTNTTLTQAVNKQLNTQEIGAINKLLTQKGITYRFS